MTERDCHPLLESSFQTQLEGGNRTVIRDGCKVELFSQGMLSYERRWEMLAHAERSIDIVTLSMINDATTQRLMRVLHERMDAGVRVRLIIDDAVLYSSRMVKSVEVLDQHPNGEVLRYHRVFRDVFPDWRQNRRVSRFVQKVKCKLKRRFHEKYMVVDGQRAILGGINWGDKYANGGKPEHPEAWRDTDVYLEGPIIADIQRQFIQSLFLYRGMEEAVQRRKEPGFSRAVHLEEARIKGEAYLQGEEGRSYFPPLPNAGTDRVCYVPHKPYDERRLKMTEAAILLIRQAKTSIYWGCHGIRPPRIIAETLAEAAARGVKVTLITNSDFASRGLLLGGLLRWMYFESNWHFRWLLERGMRIFEWQGEGPFHSKNLLIDGVVASVGSYNVSRASTFHHTESSVVIFGGSIPKEVEAQFDRDLAPEFSEEVTLDSIPAPNGFWHALSRILRWRAPMDRPLHGRNLLLPRELRTGPINEYLDANRELISDPAKRGCEP